MFTTERLTAPRGGAAAAEMGGGIRELTSGSMVTKPTSLSKCSAGGGSISIAERTDLQGDLGVKWREMEGEMEGRRGKQRNNEREP